MQPMDLKGFSAMLYTLAQVFQVELNEIQIEAYFRALMEIPIGTLQGGIAYSIKTRKFFPKPAEIRADCYSGEDDPPPVYRRALPEYVDPKAREEAMQRVKAIIESAKMKTIPKAPKDETHKQEDARKIAEEKWYMSEKHWRARWDLARMDRDLAFFKDQIPMHYRVKFLQQDREAGLA